MNDDDQRPRDGDYRKDDEKPQIVQLNASDLSKEEVELELAKAREGIVINQQQKISCHLQNSFEKYRSKQVPVLIKQAK